MATFMESVGYVMIGSLAFVGAVCLWGLVVAGLESYRPEEEWDDDEEDEYPSDRNGFVHPDDESHV